MTAAGLDINSPRVVVTWKLFLELYCTFEAGEMEKAHLIKFWWKFFDPPMSGVSPYHEYMGLLEELVRGAALNKANKTT